MKSALDELAADVGVPVASAALGVPRATAYRWRQPRMHGPVRRRPKPARALSDADRAEVLATLHSDRFVDKAPTTVHATLLDERKYLCHPRTMYRILASEHEVRERRAQVRHPNFARPELIATGPNQVWTWDVTWLRGPDKYGYYALYVILDLYSRFSPGWMLAHKESGKLAAKLFRATCKRQGVGPGVLTVHADRGAVPKGKTIKDLMLDLDIATSFSRPRVSNDNPFSESQFRTMKYCPEYPDRFDSFKHAHNFCRGFFPTYNECHRHSGIAYLTPADVHYGRADQILAQRQRVLDDAFALHAHRFVGGPPKVPALPKAVWINPPENRTEVELGVH